MIGARATRPGPAVRVAESGPSYVPNTHGVHVPRELVTAAAAQIAAAFPAGSGKNSSECTVDTLLARLGLSHAHLTDAPAATAPAWLRLALAGVAIERGLRPDAIRWLLATLAAPPDGRDTG